MNGSELLIHRPQDLKFRQTISFPIAFSAMHQIDVTIPVVTWVRTKALVSSKCSLGPVFPLVFIELLICEAMTEVQLPPTGLPIYLFCCSNSRPLTMLS